MNKITVFYDGKCGLCSKEINHYKRIAPANVFNWQDITQSSNELEKEGISLAQGLKLLHAKDLQGNMHVGVDAFILMWKQIKGWKYLGFFASLPVVKHIAQWLYRIFANKRFEKLEHCQLAAKQEKI